MKKPARPDPEGRGIKKQGKCINFSYKRNLKIAATNACIIHRLDNLIIYC